MFHVQTVQLIVEASGLGQSFITLSPEQALYEKLHCTAGGYNISCRTPARIRSDQTLGSNFRKMTFNQICFSVVLKSGNRSKLDVIIR